MPIEVQELVREYASQFSSGSRSTLEEFVSRVPADEQENLFRQLLSREIEIRRTKGESPVRDEYVERFPRWSAIVQALIAPSDDSADGAQPPSIRSLESTIGAATDEQSTGDAEVIDDTPFDGEIRELGRFQVLRLLGEGGFGQVFLAYDPRLDRMAALKVLKSGRRNRSATQERFLREGRAAAKLRHPNIVGIYEADAGIAGGPNGRTELAYIASEYVEGRTLRQAINRGQTWTPNEAAALISDIADAVGYAHREGITHRDIKPENIILNASGDPQLLDFGLAGFDDGPTTLTGQHEIIGTPHYLSPERIGDETLPSGPQADVWAIGIVLYELLTQKRPFQDLPMSKLFAAIKAEPIQPPHAICDSVPRDLDAICMMSLARDVEGRYRDGRRLHDDLRRYLNGVPVEARPLGVAATLSRWAHRNPLVAASAALVILVSSVGACVSTLFAAQARQAAIEAQLEAQVADRESERAAAKTAEAEREFLRAERGLYRARVLLAQNYWNRGDAPRVREELIPYMPADDNPSPVPPGWEWNFLWRLVNKEAIVADGHEDGISDIHLSPDGSTIASGGSDGAVRLWNAKDGAPIASRNIPAEIDSVRFHPGGKDVVTSDWAGNVVIFDRTDLSVKRTLDCHPAIIEEMELALDGTRIITSGEEAKVRIWDYETGEKIAELGGKQFADWHHQIAVSPDGRTLAFEGAGKIHLHELEKGELIRSIDEGHRYHCEVLEFSPNQTWLFSSGSTKPRFYRLDQPGEQPLMLPGENHVEQFAWASDSVHFVTQESHPAKLPEQVQVWSLSDSGQFQRISRLGVSVRDVQAAMFTPDGQSIVTGGDAGVVQTWNATNGSREEFFPGHTGEVMRLAMSPDGKQIFSAGQLDGTLRGWMVGTGRQSIHHIICGRRATAVEFDAARNQLIATGYLMNDALLRPFGLPGLDELDPLRPSAAGGMVSDFVISPDAATLVAASGKTLHFLDRDDEQKHRRVRCDSSAECLAISPDGRRLLVGYEDGSAEIRDAGDGELLRSLNSDHRSTLQAAFHPDGSQYATSGFDGTVKVWDAKTHEVIKELDWDGWFVYALAYSADGKQLAAGSHIPTVKVWETKAFNEVATLKGHGGRINSISFHPNGRRLATSSWDGSVRIWDQDTWQELCVIELGAGVVFDCTFSPDGHYLALACEDGSVHLCDGRSIADTQ